MKKLSLIILLFIAFNLNAQNWNKLTVKQRDSLALSVNKGNLYLWFVNKSDFDKWINYVRNDYFYEDRYGKEQVNKLFSIDKNSFIYSNKLAGKIGYVKLTQQDRLRLWSNSTNVNYHIIDSVAKVKYNFRRMYDTEFKK